MRALLVDDNRADVNLLQLALRSIHSDIELHIADDGVKALDILRSQAAASPPVHPDFILLDLKLPRKTGLEVLFEIKSDPDLRRIPVVVLSSSRAAIDIARAYDAQAAAYFVKPLSGFEGVLETIMAFLDAAQLPANGGLAHLRHRIAETDRRSADLAGVDSRHRHDVLLQPACRKQDDPDPARLRRVSTPADTRPLEACTFSARATRRSRPCRWHPDCYKTAV